MTPRWPVPSLLPHGGAMVLIGEPAAYGDGWAEAAVRIGEDSLFYKAGHGVPSWVGSNTWRRRRRSIWHRRPASWQGYSNRTLDRMPAIRGRGGVFPLGKPIEHSCGRNLARWSDGGLRVFHRTPRPARQGAAQCVQPGRYGIRFGGGAVVSRARKPRHRTAAATAAIVYTLPQVLLYLAGCR